MFGVRSQNESDEVRETFGQLTAITCDVAEDKARQEFLADTDVNRVMARYGAPASGPLTFGEVDYDIGLQDAIRLVDEARTAWSRVPSELREEYPTWPSLLNAVAEGLIIVEDGKVRRKPAPPSAEEVERKASEDRRRAASAAVDLEDEVAHVKRRRGGHSA